MFVLMEGKNKKLEQWRDSSLWPHCQSLIRPALKDVAQEEIKSSSEASDLILQSQKKLEPS
jgi:hypothetical protein